MNKYRTLAANTALMSAGTFGSKLLVFLMVRFYTGCLTPAEYGTADLITQTANLLIPVVSLDIPEGVFRFAADRQSDRADAFSAGVRTVTLGSAALPALLPLLQGVPGVPEYGALLVQTAFLLLRWPGWRLAQGIGLFVLLLLGFPAMPSTLRVIFHRKQADR